MRLARQNVQWWAYENKAQQLRPQILLKLELLPMKDF